jgi:hypothetical protein
MDPHDIPMVNLTPELRFLYTSQVEIEPMQQLGQSPYGERRIINIVGGAFKGPRMAGRVLRGGADWQFVRRDEVTELDARYTLETEDRALIYVSNWGLRHGPPEVMARVVAGEDVDPKEYYFRTQPRFETGAPQYQWLNGLITIAVGERRSDKVIITVYEVT